MDENKTIANPATAPGLFLTISIPTRMRIVTWDDLRPGNEIWYLIPDKRGYVREEDAHGPFKVVDQTTCTLRNTNGVELALTRKLVLLIEEYK